MNWINEALQPEHPEDCDLCTRVARLIAQNAAIQVMVVRLPCGSVQPVFIHHFQMS